MGKHDAHGFFAQTSPVCLAVNNLMYERSFETTTSSTTTAKTTTTTTKTTTTTTTTTTTIESAEQIGQDFVLVMVVRERLFVCHDSSTKDWQMATKRA